MSKYTEGCPLDHSTFERFISCDCNFATAQEVWDLKEIEITRLKSRLEKVEGMLKKVCEFYGNKDNWKITDDCIHDLIISSDVELLFYISSGVDMNDYYAGKLAREVKKEWEAL